MDTIFSPNLNPYTSLVGLENPGHDVVCLPHVFWVGKQLDISLFSNEDPKNLNIKFYLDPSRI